jgi:predicted aspartyl protease
MCSNGEPDVGRFSVEFVVANHSDRVRAEAGEIPPDQVRQTRLQGIVDSGAARLVLPENAVKDLGLAPAGEATVRYADLHTATRPMVKYVALELLGREGVFSAIPEPDRTTALIGAIVLEELDLLVDCTTQTLYPRDPDRIVSEIEGFDAMR